MILIDYFECEVLFLNLFIQVVSYVNFVVGFIDCVNYEL